jgi:hypothetical protein
MPSLGLTVLMLPVDLNQRMVAARGVVLSPMATARLGQIKNMSPSRGFPMQMSSLCLVVRRARREALSMGRMVRQRHKCFKHMRLSAKRQQKTQSLVMRLLNSIL